MQLHLTRHIHLGSVENKIEAASRVEIFNFNEFFKVRILTFFDIFRSFSGFSLLGSSLLKVFLGCFPIFLNWIPWKFFKKLRINSWNLLLYKLLCWHSLFQFISVYVRLELLFESSKFIKFQAFGSKLNICYYDVFLEVRI